MWKSQPDDKSANPASSGNAAAPPAAAFPVGGAGPRPAASKPAENFRSEIAHIGSSVVIKGELSGSEDLYLDGEVEGSVELRQHSLTIGPHGKVRANLHAREVIIHGKVDGNINGDERVELKKSAVLTGDVRTQRIVIEDGAFFKGAIDLQKEAREGKEMARGAAASAAGGFSSYSAAGQEKKS